MLYSHRHLSHKVKFCLESLWFNWFVTYLLNVLLFYEFDVISTCSRNLLCSSNSSIRRRRSLRLLEMRLLEKRLSFSLCLSHILIFSLQLLHSITSIFNTRMTAVSLSMTQGTYQWQKYRVSSQVQHNCTRTGLRRSLPTEILSTAAQLYEQELFRRWDSERELLRSAPRKEATGIRWNNAK